MTQAHEIWNRPCPILILPTHGADEDTTAILLEDLNWAFNMLSDGGDALVSTVHTGDAGATSKPISVRSGLTGTKMTIRRTPDDVSTYILGPRMPRATAAVEPGREPPARKTLNLVRILESHLRRIVDGDVVEDDAPHRTRLAALEAFVRTSGRQIEGRLTQVWLDTPWTPVKAPWMDDDGRWRASLLTPAETRAWAGPAVLGARIQGEDRRPHIEIGPMAWNVMGGLVPSDAMADLRAISTLGPVPRRRRSPS